MYGFVLDGIIAVFSVVSWKKNHNCTQSIIKENIYYAILTGIPYS